MINRVVSPGIIMRPEYAIEIWIQTRNRLWIQMCDYWWMRPQEKFDSLDSIWVFSRKQRSVIRSLRGRSFSRQSCVVNFHLRFQILWLIFENIHLEIKHHSERKSESMWAKTRVFLDRASWEVDNAEKCHHWSENRSIPFLDMPFWSLDFLYSSECFLLTLLRLLSDSRSDGIRQQSGLQLNQQKDVNVNNSVKQWIPQHSQWPNISHSSHYLSFWTGNDMNYSQWLSWVVNLLPMIFPSLGFLWHELVLKHDFECGR
jgi:hypothetical protein